MIIVFVAEKVVFLNFLCYLCAKNFHNRSKFDKVLTKNKLHSFFETRCRPSSAWLELMFGKADREEAVCIYAIHTIRYCIA